MASHEARANLREGRWQAAFDVATLELRQRPSDAEFLAISGYAAAKLGRFNFAISQLDKSRSVNPNSIDTLRWYGEALEIADRDPDALKVYETAIGLAPDDVDLRRRVASLFTAYGYYDRAISHLQAGLAVDVNACDLRLILAQALTASNRSEEAKLHLDIAVANPDTCATASGMLGYWHQARGNFSEARVAFETSIGANPRQSVAYYGWSQSNRVTKDDHEFLDRVEALLEDSNLSLLDAMYLQYVRGKALFELSDYETSMAAYDLANKAAFSHNLGGRKFDRAHYANLIDRTIAMFSAEFLDASRDDFNDATPIFIVGMMRSGTTLVEQVISSHPQVCGAGEVDYWLDESPRAVDLQRRRIDLGKLRSLREGYRKCLSGLAPNRLRVTDKMPQNFQALGLIHLAFPKSPIIHVRRNPVDTCLSIYTTAYEKSPAFAHDRSSIVFAYRQYARLVAHWRSVLPADRFFEVDYEDLIADRETTIRRLIDSCGLEWESACLSPESNQRVVATPSLWQVRQPLYTSSIERSKVYEPWLGAFAELA